MNISVKSVKDFLTLHNFTQISNNIASNICKTANFGTKSLYTWYKSLICATKEDVKEDQYLWSNFHTCTKTFCTSLI